MVVPVSGESTPRPREPSPCNAAAETALQPRDWVLWKLLIQQVSLCRKIWLQEDLMGKMFGDLTNPAFNIYIYIYIYIHIYIYIYIYMYREREREGCGDRGVLFQECSFVRRPASVCPEAGIREGSSG